MLLLRDNFCLDPDLSVKEVQLLRTTHLNSVGVGLNMQVLCKKVIFIKWVIQGSFFSMYGDALLGTSLFLPLNSSGAPACGRFGVVVSPLVQGVCMGTNVR